jgi:GNAT superfamily N-acetyltransferase
MREITTRKLGGVLRRAGRSYSVRRAQPNDLAAIINLASKLLLECEDIEVDESADSLRFDLMAEVESGASTIFLCSASGRDVGMVRCTPIPLPCWLKGPIVGVSLLWVEPEYRGKGVAALLVQSALDYARDIGAVSVLGQISVSNTICSRLAERFGFLPEIMNWTKVLEA